MQTQLVPIPTETLDRLEAIRLNAIKYMESLPPNHQLVQPMLPTTPTIPTQTKPKNTMKASRKPPMTEEERKAKQRKYSADYYARNKERHLAKCRENYLARKERGKKREYSREYYKRYKARLKKREYNRAYNARKRAERLEQLNTPAPTRRFSLFRKVLQPLFSMFA